MNLVSTFLIIISYTSLAYIQNLKSGDLCIIESSETQGICKPVLECSNGQNLGIEYTLCGFEKEIGLVCCPVESPERPTMPIQRQRISEIKCFEYKSAVYYQAKTSFMVLMSGARSQNTFESGCGNSELPLIIGGEQAKPREFPHMALIAINDGSWICGGSLISDQFVLTAAHCLLDNLSIVRLGELDYARTDDEASPEDYGIMESIPHKDYLHPGKHHDIALLKLDRIVEFNIFRRPACLTSSLEITEEMAIAAGWGNTEFDKDRSKSSMLLKVALTPFNQSECVDIYPRESYSIISEQFCAGSKTDNKDTCQGDSGGPLQVPHDNEDIHCMWKIIGVTSYGMACGYGVPGIYTKVFPYLNWIEEKVWGTSADFMIFED